jgi:hypothetical protein
MSTYSMTPDIFNAIWGNSKGHGPLSLFTGNQSDETTVVYSTGRNLDSGTRMTALSDTDFGVNNDIVQWVPTVTNTTTTPTTVTTQARYPITTVDGISTAPLGNGGESSGGTLRGYLLEQIASSVYTNGSSLNSGGEGGGSNFTGGYYATYLGTSDAANVLPPTVSGSLAATELQYCGVPYSATATEEGSYTFWSYEHMYLNPNIGTNSNAFAQALISQIEGEPAGSLSNAGLPTSSMRVSRAVDGGAVGPAGANNF